MELMHLTLILIGISVLHPRTDALKKLDEPVLFGPSAALDRTVVDFFCEIPEKPATLSVEYEIYVETNPGKVIGAQSSLSGEIATFPLIITTQHDGRLICKASGHNNTDIESSFSNGWDFRVIVPVGEVSIISHPSTENIWEGQTLTLQCNKTKGTYVSYDWLLNNAPVQIPYDRNEDTLTIHRVSAQNTGHYICVASNQFNSTTFNSSSDVNVFVKEYVSKPEISFDIVKLVDGGYEAKITCQSKKGTPLNTFSLLNYTVLIATETTDTKSVFFKVPIELNHNMGQMRCNASNEGNWVLSEPISLTVDALEKLDEPVLFGPSAALDGTVVDFFCEIPEKPATLSVEYELYVETNPGKVIGAYYSLTGEIATFPLLVTTQHDGRLICKASGYNDTDIKSSFSNGWDFRVIEKSVRVKF